MARGSQGRIRNWQDFCGSFEDVTWATTSVDLGEGWFMVSVNEGTLNKVVDEGNGVLQFETDTGNADNVVLLSGPFRPADGPLHFEARFKVSDDLVVAIMAGFQETIVMATPVLGLEFSGTTMDFIATGGEVGFSYDSDGTVDDFRACAGDGNVAVAGAGDGTRLDKGTWAANEYALTKVTLGPDGSGHCFAALTNANELTRVASYAQALTTTDLFYAILACENRDATAHDFEVDYVGCESGRNWNV